MSKFIRGITFLLPIAFLVAGCESTSYESDSISETVAFERSNPDQAVKKVFDPIGLSTSTLKEGGNDYTLEYLGSSAVNGDTEFSYRVSAAADNGLHVSIKDPSCASYVSSDPERIDNANANDDLEWNASDGLIIKVRFAGDVSEGIVNWGVKAPGSGNSPNLDGLILGPCQGVYTISGYVFLDNKGDGSGIPDFKDADEPGIANVEILLEEDLGSGFVEDARVLTSFQEGDSYGRYEFKVLGPPLTGSEIPTSYRVSIPATADDPDGINEELFNPNIFIAPTQTSYVVDPIADASGNLGFEIDVKGALDRFEAGDLVSDGLDRAYWRVQATQKGSKKYKPAMSESDFQFLLNCIGSLSGGLEAVTDSDPGFDCIRAFDGTSPDFGGDVDLLIDEIFPFLADNISGNDIGYASEILKNDSKNDEQEGLRTEILTALLNFAAGRGICDGTSLKADETCQVLDVVAMRAVIQDALVVLTNSEYVAPEGVGKASDGSVSTSRSLLSEVN